MGVSRQNFTRNRRYDAFDLSNWKVWDLVHCYTAFYIAVKDGCNTIFRLFCKSLQCQTANSSLIKLSLRIAHSFTFSIILVLLTHNNTLKNKYKDKGCSTNKTAIVHRKKKAYTFGCTL